MSRLSLAAPPRHFENLDDCREVRQLVGTSLERYAIEQLNAWRDASDPAGRSAVELLEPAMLAAADSAAAAALVELDRALHEIRTEDGQR